MIPFFRDNNNNNNKENSRGKSSIRLHAPFTRPRIVIPEKKDYRWPVTTVYQYLSRYRSPAQSESDESTVPFSNYFYAIILSNRDRFYSKERKKRNKAIDPLLSSACTRFVLKTKKRARAVFPIQIAKKIDPSPFVDWREKYYFLFSFFFYMENWPSYRDGRIKTVDRYLSAVATRFHDGIVQPFRRGGETCSYKIISRSFTSWPKLRRRATGFVTYGQ